MSHQYDIESDGGHSRKNTKESTKSSHALKTVSHRLGQSDYGDTSYENADKLEVYQVNKEKGRDSKKSTRNHSHKVRGAIERETGDNVVPFHENELLEHHTKSSVRIDDDTDIIALIQQRDAIRSRKAQELEAQKHPMAAEHIHHHDHGHHTPHHSRSSSKSVHSEKVLPELDVVVESFEAIPDAATVEPAVIQHQEAHQHEKPLSPRRLSTSSVVPIDSPPHESARVGSSKVENKKVLSNKDHDFSRKQAYALNEHQALEKNKKDPFYVQLETPRFIAQDNDFTRQDEYETEHLKGGAAQATIDVHAIERRTAQQIRSNRLGLGAVLCCIIAGILTWVAIANNGALQ